MHDPHDPLDGLFSLARCIAFAAIAGLVIGVLVYAP